MMSLPLLMKATALSSSMALASGFIWYHSGGLPADAKVSAQAGASVVPQTVAAAELAVNPVTAAVLDPDQPIAFRVWTEANGEVTTLNTAPLAKVTAPPPARAKRRFITISCAIMPQSNDVPVEDLVLTSMTNNPTLTIPNNPTIPRNVLMIGNSIRALPVITSLSRD